MTNEELAKMYQDLIFANEQMKVLVAELKDVRDAKDVIASLNSLKNIDSGLIKKQLNQIDFEKVGSQIFKNIEDKLSSSTLQMKEAQEKLEKYSIKLVQALEANEDLIYINDVAEDIREIKKYTKSYKTKTVIGISSITMILGLSFGFISTNYKSLFGDEKYEDFKSKFPSIEFVKDKEYSGHFITLDKNILIETGEYNGKQYIYFERK